MSATLTESGTSLPTGPATFKIEFDFFDRSPEGRRRRPRAVRAEAPLKVSWHWGPVEQPGVVRNICVGGCFIEAEGEVSLGDKIQFRLSVPGLLHMQMAGMVVRRQRGEGFALRFNKLSTTEQSLLERAVRHLQRHAATAKKG